MEKHIQGTPHSFPVRAALAAVLCLCLAGGSAAEELWASARGEGALLFAESSILGEVGAGGILGMELRGVLGTELNAGLRAGYDFYLPMIPCSRASSGKFGSAPAASVLRSASVVPERRGAL